MNRADALDCLATGANELGALLGNAPNDRGLSTQELKRLWLNKVTAAGMETADAKAFLKYRLSCSGIKQH
jgi:hypothetical protein